MPPAASSVRAVRLSYISPERWLALDWIQLRPSPRPRITSWSVPHRPVLVALLGLLLACSSTVDPAPAPASASASSTSVGAAPATPASALPASPASSAAMPPGVPVPDDENGGKRRKFGDAAVFVDGVPRGVLRIRELPPKLARHDATLVDGRKVARWRLAEYLQVVGVDLAKLREVHVLGGRGRTAVIPASEIVRLKDALLFSFTRGEIGGKARIHWPQGIQTNTTVDVVGAVSVYVEAVPPRYDKRERALFGADGAKIEGIPYASAEAIPKGTRVYRDGQYLGFVKKKLLADALLAPDATAADLRFSLAKFLASIGADPAKARAIDLVDGDAVSARLTPAMWLQIRDGASFAVTSGSRGRAALRVKDPPKGLAPETLVSAVLLHESAPPPLPPEKLKQTEVHGSREPQVDEKVP